MNSSVEVLPAQFDQDEVLLAQRALLRRKLGVARYLKLREAFRLADSGVHCEYYHSGESAPLVLFISGIGTYGELYAELLGRISARGFNVAAIDMRGHGYSDGERGNYTVDEAVCDLERVITLLRGRGNGQVGVYGYSIGAVLALALAESDERIGSVLCGTLLMSEIPPDWLHQMGWAWTWSSSLLFPRVRVPLRSFIDFDQLLDGHPAGEEINRDPRIVFDYPLRTLASLFTHRAGVMGQAYPFRAAIVHGEHDEVLPLEYSKRVIERVCHPIELIAVPNEGHMMPWDNPSHLSTLAADWFARTL